MRSFLVGKGALLASYVFASKTCHCQVDEHVQGRRWLEERTERVSFRSAAMGNECGLTLTG